MGEYITAELDRAGSPKGKGKKDSPEKQQARRENRLREILGMEKKFKTPTPTK